MYPPMQGFGVFPANLPHLAQQLAASAAKRAVNGHHHRSQLAASIVSTCFSLHTQAWTDHTALHNYLQVPTSTLHWHLAAFGGVLVLNVLNLVLCTSRVQFNCNLLMVYIHGVALITDAMLVNNQTPVLRAPDGSL
jgi:hypothetical protein